MDLLVDLKVSGSVCAGPTGRRAGDPSEDGHKIFAGPVALLIEFSRDLNLIPPI